MDYSKFKFRACIDWIEVELSLTSPTHAFVIRNKASLSCFVEPVNPGSAGESRLFRLRFQDPDSWTNLERRLAQVINLFPLSAEPKVTGIEVSLDAFGRSATDADMIQLTTHFYKFAAIHVSDNSRFGGKHKGGAEGITNTSMIRARISRGGVINIGNATDSIAQRIYFKRTDQGSPLPRQYHRARYEITLKSEHLPFNSLDQACEFQFSDLSKYFRFRRPSAGLDVLQSTILERQPIAGAKARRKVVNRSTRLFSPLTAADIPLNARAYDALRSLTTRMGVGSCRNGCADIPGEFES